MKIRTINVNDFGGIFNYELALNPHLNILCGENGTGKTRILQQIKESRDVIFDSTNNSGMLQNQIFALSPKRNSHRQEFESILFNLRRESKGYENFINESVTKHFNSGTFDNYSSFAELFIYFFEKYDKNGGARINAMNKVVEEFNNVIQYVFKEYSIEAFWDETKGIPVPSIIKKGNKIPLVGLSCGENEVFSLILNLYSSKERFSIYLIDEPEVHLNWHLEKQLFEFFHDFAIKYNKQLIIATHSRVVFDEKYKDIVKCLFWEGNSVKSGVNIPLNIRNLLVEEAAYHISLGGFSKPTFFVEDESHEIFLLSLASIFGKEINISKCGSSSNVINLFNLSQKSSGWDRAYFLIDGDNKGEGKVKGSNLIRLSKYCIENYSMNIHILSLISGIPDSDIKDKIFCLIKAERFKILNNNKFLDFLFDRLTCEDISDEILSNFDVSIIFKDFIQHLGFDSPNSFWINYFKKIIEVNQVDAILPIRLVELIRSID